MEKNKTPILVTGCVRFGTSWTGKLLSFSKEIAEIFEPFYPGNRSGYWYPEVFKHHFIYISDENESQYIEYVNRNINFDYRLIHAIRTIDKKKDIIRSILYYGIPFYYYRLTSKRSLFKDPYAFFSAEWLYNRYNAKVVMLIRHPAAFISSLLDRPGWNLHPFCISLLNQPLLIEDHLKDYVEDLKVYAKKEEFGLQTREDALGRAILLWRVFAKMIKYYKNKYSQEWLFVRHEDLSLNPINEFKDLYNQCDLKYSSKVEDQIIKYSFTSKTDAKFNDLQRDSKSIIFKWKDKLNKNEIRQIKQELNDVYPLFYSEKDW